MKRKPCPLCGAKGTNKGYLKHWGSYHGFSCGTWLCDYNGNGEQSAQCKEAEKLQIDWKEPVPV